MSDPATLLFVSPRFLFPVDSGGKIRTTQILRGLKNRTFKIRLVSPGSKKLAAQFRSELEGVCDQFGFWPMPDEGWRNSMRRARFLFDDLPMPVRLDSSSPAKSLVSAALRGSVDVVVFDFLHAAVLAPAVLSCPSVLFTHNVEAEIFARHRAVAGNPVMRALWASQHRKMLRFERVSLARFDVTVAVSDRDRSIFESEYEAKNTAVIPTGVDLNYFQYREPVRNQDILFCGSMDWMANQDAVRYFMNDIWPAIASRNPRVRMTVVGRSPPASLVGEARSRGLPWEFTGFVDDVRPLVAGAAVSVIPLRIAGGTRLKVYEAMAMGAAVVSTSIGVEGLPVVDREHCLVADVAADFSEAVVRLLNDAPLRHTLSRNARSFVDSKCGFKVASQVFEQACIQAIRVYEERKR